MLYDRVSVNFEVRGSGRGLSYDYIQIFTWKDQYKVRKPTNSSHGT